MRLFKPKSPLNRALSHLSTIEEMIILYDHNGAISEKEHALLRSVVDQMFRLAELGTAIEKSLQPPDKKLDMPS